MRIKSQRGKGGLVENISYSDITMKNVDPAITLTCYYMFNSAGDAVQEPVRKWIRHGLLAEPYSRFPQHSHP